MEFIESFVSNLTDVVSFTHSFEKGVLNEED